MNYLREFNELIPQKIKDLVLSGEGDSIRLALEIGNREDLIGWYWNDDIMCKTNHIPYFPFDEVDTSIFRDNGKEHTYRKNFWKKLETLKQTNKQQTNESERISN